MAQDDQRSPRSATLIPKDPSRVDRGRRGARAKWGPQRIVRLDRIDPATAEIIRAILRAQENAGKAA